MLDLEHYDRKQLKAALEAQVASRKLRRIGKTRYQWIRDVERAPTRERAPGARGGRRPSAGPRIEGHYTRVRAGYGFVEVLGRAAERFPRDILIPAGMEGEALHGDRVSVEIVRRDVRAKRFVGRISAVTSRVHEQIIGTLERSRERLDRWYRRTSCSRRWRSSAARGSPPRLRTRVASPRASDASADADPRTGRRGRGDPRCSRRSGGAVPHHRLRARPAHRVSAGGARRSRALAGRPVASGLRGPPGSAPTCPSSPSTARRRATSTMPSVSRPRPAAASGCGSPSPTSRTTCNRTRRSDAEAARRGTSVYFPDRAIPMLPPQLSTQLCSLNPNVTAWCSSLSSQYDGDGQRHDAHFYRGVIKSHARLTYTQVAAVLSDCRHAGDSRLARRVARAAAAAARHVGADAHALPQSRRGRLARSRPA